MISFSKERNKIHLAFGVRCGLFEWSSGERYRGISQVRFGRILLIGAFICLFVIVPKVVQPSDSATVETPSGQDELGITNPTQPSILISGQSDPGSAVSKNGSPARKKPAKSARKAAVNPFSAEALLADHPAPLLKPKSELATPLSGRKKPESVELFKKLLHQGKRMDRYQGRVFVAEGEAYYGKGVPAGYFMLFRWYIDCCTAEVKPVGILVRGSLAEDPDKATWVMVDGVVELHMFDGVRLPYLAAGQVENMPAPPPEKQYISY